jgi:hypothetical protein
MNFLALRFVMMAGAMLLRIGYDFLPVGCSSFEITADFFL